MVERELGINMSKKSVKIFVDVHEQDSGLLEVIQGRGLQAEQKSMESGDVVLYYKGKSVAIEMKRTDYISSLHSGRLKNQICKMSDHYDFYILIVEGAEPYIHNDDTGDTIEEKMHRYRKSLRTLNRRITVYEVKNQDETLDIIEEIVRDLKNNKLFVLKRPVLIEAEMSGPMKFICGLPNVKQVLGEKILDTYGCAKHALDDVDNWIKIDGIGKVKLAKIKDTLMEGEYT